jgi:antitoxin component YwqK of YwqJK toxin-antitoxin module
VAPKWGYILFLALQPRRSGGKILSSKSNATMETKVERIYWGDGRLRLEQPYVGGKQHGMAKWWWESGQLESEQPYVNGVRHGMAKWWGRNGDIDCFWLWNQGELVAKFFPKNETQRWKLK